VRKLESAVKTKMLIMIPEQPNTKVEVELPKYPSYSTLRDVLNPIIGCKYIEHVSVLADFEGATAFRRADMFVDEDGHARKLPFNGFATDIYRRNALINQGVTDPETLSWIAGTAVLFDRIVWT
jgi:hypothetical protein